MNERKVTPEEFAKKYRELFDMSAMIDGVSKMEFHITTHGIQDVCDEIKALVDMETAKATLLRLQERRD